MPAKRKYSVSKRTASKPPLKRRRAIRTYSGATSSKVPLSMDHQLLRTRQNCVLRYHETFSLNPTIGGVPALFSFRSNSCFDPNFTGIGHQPRGYDQIMSMYQYLSVREAQIEIWFTTSDGAPVIVGIQADGTVPTSGFTRNSLIEGRTAVYKAAGGISSSGPGYVTLRVKPWELAATTITETDYKHLVAGNPVVTQFFNVGGMPLEATDSGEIQCVARITYHCQVTEPIQPAAS